MKKKSDRLEDMEDRINWVPIFIYLFYGLGLRVFLMTSLHSIYIRSALWWKIIPSWVFLGERVLTGSTHGPVYYGAVRISLSFLYSKGRTILIGVSCWPLLLLLFISLIGLISTPAWLGEESCHALINFFLETRQS